MSELMRKKNQSSKYMADMPASRWKDIGEQRFGRLVAKEPTGEKRHGQHVWLCRCDCGAWVELPIGSLRPEGKGGSRSCGCLLKEAPSSVRHGMTDTAVHNRWLGIMKRCYTKTASNYHRYGGKGVRVCADWHTFENFWRDMGEPPSNTHQIDRINSDLDYTPENCQWLERREHAKKTAADRKARKESLTTLNQ